MAICATWAACGGAVDEAGRVRVVVARPERDTVRFRAGAAAQRCAAGAGLLIEGVERGNGVLVLIRSADSVPSGDFPLLAPRDRTTPRGAMVSVRYMTAEVAHGFSLDTGVVTVAGSPSGGGLSARARGSGLETGSALRATLEAEFEAVPLPGAADTVPCEVAP